MKNWIIALGIIALIACGTPKEETEENTPQQESATNTEETIKEKTAIVKTHPFFVGSWIEINESSDNLLEISIQSNGTMFQSQGTSASAGTWEQMSEDRLRVSLDDQAESQNWFVSSNEDSTINIAVQVPKGKSALKKRFKLLNQ